MENTMIQIKMIFHRVFGEALFPRGFLICKKYGCFMRLVNDEVLQFFMLSNEQANRRWNKAFMIRAGMISMYYYKPIDKDHLLGNSNEEKTYRYEYRPEDLDEAERQMNAALEEASTRIFPTIDSVRGLHDYVRYCKIHKIDAIRYATGFVDDSLALIVTNDHDDFEELFQELVEREKELYMQDGKINVHGEAYKWLRHCIIDMGPGERDKVYADKELYAAALEEAKRRKEAHLEFLRELKMIDFRGVPDRS